MSFSRWICEISHLETPAIQLAVKKNKPKTSSVCHIYWDACTPFAFTDNKHIKLRKKETGRVSRCVSAAGQKTASAQYVVFDFLTTRLIKREQLEQVGHQKLMNWSAIRISYRRVALDSIDNMLFFFYIPNGDKDQTQALPFKKQTKKKEIVQNFSFTNDSSDISLC